MADDGLVYVADRENRRVQMFTSEGKFLRQYVRHNAPFARNVALSPDAQQRFLPASKRKVILAVPAA